MSRGRDTKITLLRRDESARNAFNEVDESDAAYSAIGHAFAARTDISDSEKIAAGQEISVSVARFVVRSNAKTRTLTGGDRLRTAEGVWNIKGAKPSSKGRARMIELTAERKDADIGGVP